MDELYPAFLMKDLSVFMCVRVWERETESLDSSICQVSVMELGNQNRWISGLCTPEFIGSQSF